MKLKDFLLKKAEAAGIRSQDFTASLQSAALQEIEISDADAAKWTEAYLTRDQAKADTELVTDIRKATRLEIFSRVDDRLEPLYRFLSPEKAKELSKEKVFETYKRMELLADALGDSWKNATVKTSEDVQKTENEWSAKLKAATDAHKKELSDLVTKHKDTQLNQVLRRKLNEYKFGESFNSLKETIHNNIVAKVKGFKYEGNPITLELDDDGDSIHVRKNVDGVLKDVYVKDSNDKLTVEKLLETEVEPFIIKSNGSGDDTTTDGQNGTKQQRQPLPKDATLHDMIAAGFSN